MVLHCAHLIIYVVKDSFGVHGRCLYLKQCFISFLAKNLGGCLTFFQVYNSSFTARRLWNGTRLRSRPFVQSAWPCALNKAQFAADPGSKRNPCERWKGAYFVGVLDLIGCETDTLRLLSGLWALSSSN